MCTNSVVLRNYLLQKNIRSINWKENPQSLLALQEFANIQCAEATCHICPGSSPVVAIHGPACSFYGFHGSSSVPLHRNSGDGMETASVTYPYRKKSQSMVRWSGWPSAKWPVIGSSVTNPAVRHMFIQGTLDFIVVMGWCIIFAATGGWWSSSVIVGLGIAVASADRLDQLFNKEKWAIDFHLWYGTKHMDLRWIPNMHNGSARVLCAHIHTSWQLTFLLQWDVASLEKLGSLHSPSLLVVPHRTDDIWSCHSMLVSTANFMISALAFFQRTFHTVVCGSCSSQLAWCMDLCKLHMKASLILSTFSSDTHDPVLLIVEPVSLNWWRC